MRVPPVRLRRVDSLRHVVARVLNYLRCCRVVWGRGRGTARTAGARSERRIRSTIPRLLNRTRRASVDCDRRRLGRPGWWRGGDLPVLKAAGNFRAGCARCPGPNCPVIRSSTRYRIRRFLSLRLSRSGQPNKYSSSQTQAMFNYYSSDAMLFKYFRIRQYEVTEDNKIHTFIRYSHRRRVCNSVCLSVCPHNTAETTFTKLATGIVNHESSLTM